MVTGGGFESGKRLFIIERRDCPSLVLHKTDWLVYNGRKYAIENYEEYEFDAAYIITGKEMPGEGVGVVGRWSIAQRHPGPGLAGRRGERNHVRPIPTGRAGCSHP